MAQPGRAVGGGGEEKPEWIRKRHECAGLRADREEKCERNLGREWKQTLVLTIPRSTRTLKNYVWPLGENTKQGPELEPCLLYPNFQNVAFSPIHPLIHPTPHPSICPALTRPAFHYFYLFLSLLSGSHCSPMTEICI